MHGPSWDKSRMIWGLASCRRGGPIDQATLQGAMNSSQDQSTTPEQAEWLGTAWTRGVSESDIQESLRVRTPWSDSVAWQHIPRRPDGLDTHEVQQEHEIISPKRSTITHRDRFPV